MGDPAQQQRGDVPCWDEESFARTPESDAFEDLIGRMRRLQETMSSVRLPAEIAASTGRVLDDTASRLGNFVVPDAEATAGVQMAYPGRSQLFVPVVEYMTLTRDRARGTVRFTRAQAGRNGAVHGGAVSLVLDEVCGVMVNSGASRFRTASTTVDYEAVTPVGAELCFHVQVDRVDGRKVFVVASIAVGETVTARARSLFICLRADQL